jgi:hypothetical protein
MASMHYRVDAELLMAERTYSVPPHFGGPRPMIRPKQCTGTLMHTPKKFLDKQKTFTTACPYGV